MSTWFSRPSLEARSLILCGLLLALCAGVPAWAQDADTTEADTEAPGERRVVIHDDADESGSGVRARGSRRDGGVRIRFDTEETPRAGGRDEQITKHADYVRFGESVTIDADERISGDVVSIGGSITVNGSVHGDCVSVGGTIVLGPNAYVSGDVVSVGGTVSLADSAEVGGDAVSVWGAIDASPTANVYGEIVESGVRINLPDGVWLPGSSRGFGHDIWSLFRRVVWVLIVVGIGLLAFSLFPSRMRRLAETARGQGIVAFFAGLAGWVLLLPVFVILCITIIGIPLALLMIPLTPVIILFGYLGVAYSAGKRLRPGAGLGASLLAGVVLLEGLILIGRTVGLFGSVFDGIGMLISLIGHGVVFVAVTTGFGAFLITRFRGEEPPQLQGSGAPGAPVMPPVESRT